MGAVALIAGTLLLRMRTYLQQEHNIQQQNQKWEATAKTVVLLGPLDDGLPSPDLGTHFDIRTSKLQVGMADDGSDRLKNGEVTAYFRHITSLFGSNGSILYLILHRC